MIEGEDFYNDGFGWFCKRCEAQLNAETEENKGSGEEKLPRYYREGEAESKKMLLSAPLAKWADPTQRRLFCPNCGITELIEKS